MVPGDIWEPIVALRQTLLDEDRVIGPDAERQYDVVQALVLDAVHRGDRDHLNRGFRTLRRLYEVLAANCDDDYETERAFHLGRIVELVEIAGAAIEHAPPQAVGELLADRHYLMLVAALHEAARESGVNKACTSMHLAKRLDWDKSSVSRRLTRLNQLGLVVSRKNGQKRMSRLTLAGERALEHCGAQANLPPNKRPSWPTGPEFWKKSGEDDPERDRLLAEL